MDKLYHEVQDILRQTRTISLPHFGKIAYADKGDRGVDLVTDIDIAVEEFLREKLHERDPSIPFVGEETGGDSSVGTYWICDPIDGTDPYVRGMPFATTMLALIRDDQVEYGFIYDFLTDTLFHAKRSAGAYRDDTPIHVQSVHDRQAEVFVESRDYALKLALYEKYLYVHAISAGNFFCLLAQGKIDAIVVKDCYGKEYDFAAGMLIAQEAGAKVTNIGTETYDHRNLDAIAAPKELHTELTEFILEQDKI